MTRRANADQITALLERCLEADFQIERNVGTPLVLEALLDAFAQRLAAERKRSDHSSARRAPWSAGG